MLSITKQLFFKKNKRIHFIFDLLNNSSSNLKQIQNHPFNYQLFDGTLSSSTFGNYLRDDFYYLNQFAVALKTLSQRALKLNLEIASHLNFLANDIINSELSMQLKYNEYFANTLLLKPGITISSYVEYQLKTVLNAQIPEALCSVLPCFWVYYQLGKKRPFINSLHNNPYKDWIDTYSSPDFVKTTKQLVDAINKLSLHASPELKSKMKNAFSKGVQFELNFFDEVWNTSIEANPTKTNVL